jgi:hypothetical protein
VCANGTRQLTNFCNWKLKKKKKKKKKQKKKDEFYSPFDTE